MNKLLKSAVFASAVFSCSMQANWFKSLGARITSLGKSFWQRQEKAILPKQNLHDHYACMWYWRPFTLKVLKENAACSETLLATAEACQAAENLVKIQKSEEDLSYSILRQPSVELVSLLKPVVNFAQKTAIEPKMVSAQEVDQFTCPKKGWLCIASHGSLDFPWSKFKNNKFVHCKKEDKWFFCERCNTHIRNLRTTQLDTETGRYVEVSNDFDEHIDEAEAPETFVDISPDEMFKQEPKQDLEKNR